MGSETTAKLYYDDPMMFEFDARITARIQKDGKTALVLDRTAFYPEGGGQPGDSGRLDGMRVEDTTNESGHILHWISEDEAPGEGDVVIGHVDRARRIDHMQQHSGQHLLSQAFESLFDWPTVGFHLGTDDVTIDLASDSVSPSELEQAERRANQAIFDDLPRRIDVYHAVEDIPAALRGTHAPDAEELKVNEGFRVVSFGEYDSVPCGGTHVERTGQVGLIKLLGTERVRNDTRVHFVAGWRCLQRFEEYRQVVAGLTERLTTGMTELHETVEKLLEENRNREKTIRELQSTVHAYHADELLRGAEQLPSGGHLIVSREESDMQGLQFLATHVTRQAHTIALLGGVTGDVAQFVFVCSDVPTVNCSSVLREAFTGFGGRGGGNATRAQGGGIAATDAEAVLEQARNIIREQLKV